MNALSRPVIALAIVLAGGGVLMALPSGASLLTPVVSIAIGVLALIVAGSGLDDKRIEELRRAVSSARKGQVPSAPPGASATIARVYDELERIAETCREAAQAHATLEELRGENAKLSASISDAKARVSDLERTVERGGRLDAEAVRRKVAAVSVDVDVASELGQHNGELIERAAGQVEGIADVVTRAAAQVESLAVSASESSAAIAEMTATKDQMVRSIGELGVSVRDSVSSMEEMAYSIKEVARNIDALSQTAEETSTSMNEMDVSIDQVQSNANETARLSEEVARDAEQGAESILKTIGEIYRIKESSQEAVSVISDLGSRIDAIGQILNVIDEVAEQTNLLALNAAIIAAQAGEHGKGFAVVADEIKDLAERAGASTKEIAELIKTIQAESRNAIQAVERGAQNVDRGVQVSNEAERALKKILESSQKSTEMVRAIARATVEQAKGSRQVTDSIGRIAETVQQIAAATAEQARGSELIMTSGEKMRSIAQQVERSSEEQVRGGRQSTQMMEQMALMLRELNEIHSSRDISEAQRVAAELRRGVEQQREALQRLVETSRELRDLAE